MKEILDEPLDEEQPSYSFLKPSHGINDRILGISRFFLMLVASLFLYFTWTRSIDNLGLTTLNWNLVYLVATIILATTLIYHIPQATKELIEHHSMFDKNRLRIYALLFPIIIIAGIIKMLHHMIMSGINPLHNFWLPLILILVAIGVIVRDVHYIRINSK